MNLEDDERLALSNAVLHALGCVATKIGFVDIFSGSREMWPGSDRLRAIYFSSRAVSPGELISFQVNYLIGWSYPVDN
jgi:hypothetical protein